MFRANTLILVLAFFSQGLLAFEASDNAWPDASATFFVGIPGIAPSGETWDAAFKRAMAAWTTATNFNFFAEDQGGDPCAGQNTGALGNGIGGVGFADNRCGTEFGSNVLAITLTTLSCTNPGCTGKKDIVEADIVFNANENWDIYSGPLLPQTSEFERVALHELGHALGLDHESSASAIMQPFASNIATLQPDDISGANFIYGGTISTPSIYDIPIKLPSKTSFSGPDDVINFAGTLATSDASLENRFIDVYQLTFENDSEISVSLSSLQFGPFLILARVTSTQQLVPGSTASDKNLAGSSSANLQQPIAAGSYWVGVTSVAAADTGSYNLTVDAKIASEGSSFETFTSIYGIDVEINPNPLIKGALRSNDQKFDNKFIDIYQFEVTETVTLRIELTSSRVDTVLLVVDVLSDQQLGSVFLRNDDSKFSTDSRIEATLSPGTYWMGATSFSPNDFGDYQIQTSVVLP